MYKFLQIAVPILVVADFLIRWVNGLLDWFSIALLIAVTLVIIGSFVDGPAEEWLGAAAGFILVGRSAIAYSLTKRDREIPICIDTESRR
ncbi:MAG: hypothetical protein ACJ71U_19000 [Terriglobales bacterium]